MKDKFDNKPLEEFFHSYLDTFEGEPGDDFWEELEPLIPPPPKKRRRLLIWWWGLGLGLALGLLWYVWNKGRDVNVLSQQVEVQQVQIDALIEKQEKMPDVVSEEIEKTTSSETKGGSHLQQQKSLVNDSNIPPIKITPSLVSTFGGTDIAMSNVMIAGKKDSISEKQNPQNEERPASQEIDLLDKNLSLVKLGVDQNDTLEIDFLKMDSLDIIPTFKASFDVGVFYEKSVLANLRSRRDFGFLNQKNIDFQGATLGLNIGWQLKKHWRLQTGIGRAKMKMDTRSETSVDFTDFEGHHEEGFLVNNYTYKVATPFGLTSYTSEMGHKFVDNPEVDPKEGKEIMLQFSERDILDYLYLPLQLEYSSGGSRWKWTMGLGVDYHYLLKKEAFTLEEGKSQKDGTVFLREIKKVAGSQLSGLQKSFWSARAMAGVSFQPIKRWQVTLSGAYEYSLEALAEFGPRERPFVAYIPFDTKLDFFKINAGIKYKF